jgi:superfamily II DNA or RNA helicase
MATYAEFLEHKATCASSDGFDISDDEINSNLFPFQKAITAWALRKGRAAIFADCGLGKTPMQLIWARHIVQETNKKVLILTPLAVSAQTIREGEKFGVECKRSHDGSTPCDITVTNYEQLHKFDSGEFSGIVCDESSILKSFDGARRNEITHFMRRIPYRLLATATAAPNDYIELGTSSEALGYFGHIDMLNRFFVNEQNNSAARRFYGEAPKWRFKGHGETPFWRWVTSWARAGRDPSDFGFDDDRFRLPPLHEKKHLVEITTPPDGMLFNLPAVTLHEQRAERKRTITERCERAAALVADTDEPALVWCHMNAEGDLLEKIIPDAVQVSGSDSNDVKEERLLAFADGQVRVLVTKPKIGAWGLNFQHCAHIVYFPSHSYEQYYQAVRRCWRFGQTRPVVVDIVLTEGERRVMANLQRKSEAAATMFDRLVGEMNRATHIKQENRFTIRERRPAWLA